jgi:formate hydrogenlyase subunit 3/multisubunit Na+/H+ antiporter MnhD subunit
MGAADRGGRIFAVNLMQLFSEWYPQMVLTAALVAPVALALLGAVSSLRRHIPRMAVLAVLPALICALTVPIGATVTFSWLVLESRFALDATGQFFLLFTSMLWLLCALFAMGYMARDEKRFRFFFGFILAMGGNFGLILAVDMLSYLVAFAMMSFASYSLVVHTQKPEAVRSGRVYIVLVVIGEILLFSALILHAGNGGDTNLQGLSGVLTAPKVAVLLALGFGIKAGAVLLHVWLPLAHTVAPVPASAVLSGSMIKAGLLGWIRFLPASGAGDAAWGVAFIVAGITAAFYGVAMGLGQKHPKTVLAYSSISQMGLITIAFGIGLTHGIGASAAAAAVLVYAFHHALAKGALFLGVGVVGGIEDRSRNRVWVMAVLGVAAFSLAGAPLTTGAVAKTALKTAMIQLPAEWQQVLAMLLPLSAIGTATLMGRFFYTLQAYSGHSRVSTIEIFAWIALMVLSATVLFVLPLGRQLTAAMLKPGSIWLSLWPVAVGTGLTAWVWWRSQRTGRGMPWRPPAGDVLVPAEWLAESAGRWARKLMGSAAWVFRADWKSKTKGRVDGISKRIEMWETGFSRWNTSGLIFTGIVCTLLYALTRL